MATKSWNDEREAMLVAAVNGLDVVSQDKVREIAADMETTARSIGSKLRKMGYEVEKATGAKSSWSDDEQEALIAFLNANSGAFTYAEVASAVAGGKFNAKQVQGKVLSLEMTDHVKPTPKAETARSYTAEEEDKIVALVADGTTIEDLAEALGRPVNAIRGKCLSLLKEERIAAIPKQATSNAKAKVDVLDGVNHEEMTVAEIAVETGRTERGIKAILTRRGLKASDYDGAARAEKLAAKKEAE